MTSDVCVWAIVGGLDCDVGLRYSGCRRLTVYSPRGGSSSKRLRSIFWGSCSFSDGREEFEGRVRKSDRGIAGDQEKTARLKLSSGSYSIAVGVVPF